MYIESQDLAHFLWPWLYYHVKTNLQVQWTWEVRWFSLIMISYECFNTLITSYMSQVIFFFYFLTVYHWLTLCRWLTPCYRICNWNWTTPNVYSQFNWISWEIARISINNFLFEKLFILMSFHISMGTCLPQTFDLIPATSRLLNPFTFINLFESYWILLKIDFGSKAFYQIYNNKNPITYFFF